MNLIRSAIKLTIALLIIPSCQQNNSEKEDNDEAKRLFTTYCAGCHGQEMQAFVDRRWKNGNSKQELIQTISKGIPDLGMPSWEAAFSSEQIEDLAAYLREGIEKVNSYKPPTSKLVSDTFQTQHFRFHLDTIASEMNSPWGMDFLPDGSLVVTEKSGELVLIKNKKKTTVSGVPEVQNDGQGGLLDVILHPDFPNNQWIYLSYSGIKKEGDKVLSTTIVERAKLANNRLSEQTKIFEALPYTTSRSHYGSRMVFDQNGLLYISVGDRRNRDENPQSLANHCGKIHRIKDDGSIPADNPFVNEKNSVSSIYSYGIRNPQGLTIHHETGMLWEHEHGPKGGDEINIIVQGKNYGWPVISYGINYDGSTFTNMVAKEGMEQPLHYWVPSIAPSGMTFVTSNKYPGWKGNLLVGSLKYRYLNICEIGKNKKVMSENRTLQNIGRLRNVKQGPDGYLYVSVEQPGYIFKLIPLEE